MVLPSQGTRWGSETARFYEACMVWACVVGEVGSDLHVLHTWKFSNHAALDR
jgi:hypothetical protein